jgi:hypothetical protein
MVLVYIVTIFAVIRSQSEASPPDILLTEWGRLTKILLFVGNASAPLECVSGVVDQSL